MAFVFVRSLVTANEITGTGSYTLTDTGTATVGNTLYAVVTSDGNAVNQVTSLADNKGNVWTKDRETVNTAAATERYIAFWRAPITTGGTGLVITVTYVSASSNNSGLVVQEFSNSVGAAVLDQQAAGGATVATLAPTTAISPATTNANELVIGGFVSNSTQTSFTAGTGFSNALSVIVSNANAGMESKIVITTGTQVATATLGTARAYGAGLVTYFETPAVVAGITYIPYQLPWLRR